MSEQVMADPRVKDEFAKVVLDVVYEGFMQRRAPKAAPPAAH
jgi:hypothetical protein